MLWTTQLLNKFTNMFALDVSQVVQNFDDFLQSALVTTTSFQNILDGKLNRKNRILQLIALVYLFVYLIPRYLILCYAYTQDVDTRHYYQYLLGDYAEEMGLLGRTGIACALVFYCENFFNSVLLREYESCASLEYLTDWVYRTPDKKVKEHSQQNERFVKDYLDTKMKHKLMSQLHHKTVIAKTAARTTNFALLSYEFILLIMFLYNQKPSLLVSSLASFHCLTIMCFLLSPGYHFHALYLSFIVVTDYFVIRIHQTKLKVVQLKTALLTNQNLTRALNDYDELVSVFIKYNKVLRHLLRNMMQFYAIGLTGALFLGSLEVEPWIAAFIITFTTGYSLVIFGTGVYVSQLHSKIFDLHKELASISARYSIHRNVSWKSLFRLRLVIHELGSLEQDGQFVIGLRDGNGPAISRQEIAGLTMTTLSNTIMLMKFVKQGYI